MKSTKSLKVYGEVKIKVREQLNGSSCVNHIFIKNLETRALKTNLIKALVPSLQAQCHPVGSIQIGSGIEAPTLEDVALSNSLLTKNLEESEVDESNSQKVNLTFQKITLDELNGETLTELGLFSNEETPTLFARVLINPPIQKDDTKELTFIWSIQVL